MEVMFTLGSRDDRVVHQIIQAYRTRQRVLSEMVWRAALERLDEIEDGFRLILFLIRRGASHGCRKDRNPHSVYIYHGGSITRYSATTTLPSSDARDDHDDDDDDMNQRKRNAQAYVHGLKHIEGQRTALLLFTFFFYFLGRINWGREGRRRRIIYNCCGYENVNIQNLKLRRSNRSHGNLAALNSVKFKSFTHSCTPRPLAC